MTRTLHALTPTFRPAGGVVKVMDYVQHARSLGFAVSVWCPEPYDAGGPLFDVERLRDLPSSDVEFHGRDRLDVGPDDLVLVSLPDNYEVAWRSLPRGASPDRIVHLVQNTRHTNPRWRAGYPTRLLTRPASRIAINDIVADEIRPWVDPRSLLRTIEIGHDTAFFAERRAPGRHHDDPLRVGYTTWKSDVGERVAARLADDDRFAFRAIRTTAGWDELRELYRWSEVFLSTPEPQEGMYLPGLEAMAAGCLVVTPDVGGNRAYCRFGENSLLVDFDDEASYAATLVDLAGWDGERLTALREAGYASVAPFDLGAERVAFGRFVDDVTARVHTHEA